MEVSSMRFLVISLPRSETVPPELLPGLLDAEREWRGRYSDRIDSYGWFAGGGGFGIVDAGDETTLSRMVTEHPFTPFGELQIRPIVDADVAAGHLREVLEKMAATA
jgi:hypothetical protein